ncbi:uncharacterized protein LOC127795210 [Diospyros lotus]|uniref:uncharacterized protein LOC127795210 n=1 Tax=Diospyros lotus TaxID=55363 RepID=UPI00225193ED|nr:uncharacterized protein LOC127795210 [Diospyros lotus]
MRAQVLVWLFFFLCARALPCRASESSITPKPRGSDQLLLCEKQFRDETNAISETYRQDDQRRRASEVHEIIHKRKGVYGGADIYKRPPKSRSGASPLPVLSAAIGHVVVGFLAFAFCL